MSSPWLISVRRSWREIAVAFAAALAGAANATDWVPVQDMDLTVQAGSVLDLSALVEPGPAGKHGWAVSLKNGHIGFESRRTPQRFFSASFAFSPASGGFPTKKDAQRTVTQLLRTGYNAIRLQNVDANLMSGRVKDFDFDAEQFDRFQYFLAQLKQAGIYVLMDVMHLDNGGFGGIFPHRWVKTKHQLRSDLYVDSTARDHWLRLLIELLGKRNPYTNTVPLQDPAILGLILVNEGGVVELAFRGGGGFDAAFPAIYAPLFRDWLIRRYANDVMLKRVWKTELGVTESLTGEIKTPYRLKGQNARTQDFMRFITDLEQETFQWLADRTRERGFLGLVTAFNNWDFLQSTVTRTAVPFIDMHGYHNLPSGFVNPGSRVEQTSAVENSAKFVRVLGSTRQWGKPFTVSEYGQPFWNSWRRESIAVGPAYAALQDWDLIAQFAEQSVQLDYAPSPYARRKAIYPWGVSMDPVLRTGERLAALLYRRSDVQPSPTRLRVSIDADEVFEKTAGWGQLLNNWGPFTLVTGIGLDFSKRGSVPSSSADFLVTDSALPSGWTGVVMNAAARLGWLGAGKDVLQALKHSGHVPNDNRTDLGRSIFQSDTGELLLDAPARRFAIDTPRTDAVAFPDGIAASGALAVRNPSVPVLVAVSSMDGEPVEASGRLLLFVLTDAQNSGMQFADETRMELRKLGSLPVLLQRVALDLELATRHGEGIRAYALSLSGQRRDVVSVMPTAGGLHLHLDTGTLAHGPTTMFELVQE